MGSHGCEDTIAGYNCTCQLACTSVPMDLTASMSTNVSDHHAHRDASTPQDHTSASAHQHTPSPPTESPALPVPPVLTVQPDTPQSEPAVSRSTSIFWTTPQPCPHAPPPEVDWPQPALQLPPTTLHQSLMVPHTGSVWTTLPVPDSPSVTALPPST